jgi:hypothetical protein
MSAEIPGELAVTNYELSLFAHISAAIVGLGAAFVELLTYPVALRMDPRHLPYKHRLQLVINALLALPALVVLLATGLYQVKPAAADHRPPPPPLRPNASAPRFVTSSGTSVMAAAASACDGSDPLPTR